MRRLNNMYTLLNRSSLSLTLALQGNLFLLCNKMRCLNTISTLWTDQVWIRPYFTSKIPVPALRTNEVPWYIHYTLWPSSFIAFLNKKTLFQATALPCRAPDSTIDHRVSFHSAHQHGFLRTRPRFHVLTDACCTLPSTYWPCCLCRYWLRNTESAKG